jgi:NhaC family Na+:H+ antiporter
MGKAVNNNIKPLSAQLALFGFLLPLILILALLYIKVDIKIALAAAISVESIFAVYLGYSWEEIEKFALKGISRVNQTVIVMLLIGMLIGVWICAGSVQTMLYYGINMINPKFFLPIAFFICIITSTMTGTSWGTAGTMGIALIGIAQGLNIPTAMAAGAIISGALVGDKLSPLSDTTLLAAAVTEVKLYDHIISLCHVTIPVSIIAAVFYTFLGFRYVGGTADLESIRILSESLQSSCTISPLMLVPLIFVLLMSAMKKPSIPVFAGGVLLGIIWAIVFQDMALSDVVKSTINGFVSKTGNADIDKLLTRGGAMDMAGTIFLCIGAGMFAGVFECTGVLSRLMQSLVHVVKNVGALVSAVTITGIALMFGGAGQSCTITLPAVAFRKAFEDMDVHPSVLSRTLECTGTVLGSIVPWDASAILYSGLFGVSVMQYLPYSLLSYLSPIAAVVTAYIGFGVFKYNEEVHFFRHKAKKS